MAPLPVQPLLIGHRLAGGKRRTAQFQNVMSNRRMIPIRWMDADPQQGRFFQRGKNRPIPSQAANPPPPRSHAPDQTARGVNSSGNEIRNRRDPRGVAESRLAHRRLRFRSQQPRRGDEPLRLHSDRLEFPPPPRQPPRRLHLFQIEKLPLAGRVGLRDEFCENPLRSARFAPVPIPMQHRLVTLANPLPEPFPKLRIRRNPPAPMMIRHHQQRCSGTPERRQIPENPVGRGTRGRAHIMDRDHQRTISGSVLHLPSRHLGRKLPEC